MKKLRVI